MTMNFQMKAFLYTAICNFVISSVFSEEFPVEEVNRRTLDDFVSHLPFQSFDGLAQASRIVGGIQSNVDRYPYQVSLIENDTHFCGGSLIAPDWVLSAAHCSGYATHVQIGRFDLEDDTEEYEKIAVHYEIKHPDYDILTQDNDVMLIKLTTPSMYQPVKLDDGSQNLGNGQTLTVMGWGKISSFGPPSDTLLEVDVDFFPSQRCNRRYNARGAFITRNMMCAARTGKDACQGDSGGPLIKKGDTPLDDVQIGIVSWGIGCARRFLPGVYSRVSEALDFIDTYVPNRK